MQPILSDSERERIHQEELEAKKENARIHSKYHARQKIRREIVERFALSTDHMIGFVEQKSRELGIDQEEVFNQVAINLSAVVQKQLDTTRERLWPVITRHC